MNKDQAKKYKDQLDVLNKNYLRNAAYYSGNNPEILADKSTDEYGRLKKSDRRIPLPIARKLINTLVGFQFSDIAYSETGQSINTEMSFTNLITLANTEIDIEEKTEYKKYIDSLMEYNDFDILTLQTAIESCNHGRAYLIFYFADNMLKIDTIPANQIYPVYTDTLNPMMEKAIRYYCEKFIDDNGKEQEKYYVDIYTKDGIESYIATKDDYSDIVLNTRTINTIKIMHVVELSIFRDKKPLIEHAYGMIDEIDRVMSKNMAEELASNKAAILLLSQFLDKTYKDENGQTAYDRFQQSNILEGYSKDSDYAAWLTKQIQDSFIFGTYDRLTKDIFELCDIPNFSDSESWGNTISGVSAGYRLLGFLFLCNQTFRMFTEGLRQCIDIMNAYTELLANNSAVKSSMNTLQITSNRVLPKNLLENSQVAGMLKGLVSKKTLYKLFPELISDIDKEADASEDELENETNRLMGSVKEPTTEETDGMQETKETEEVV